MKIKPRTQGQKTAGTMSELEGADAVVANWHHLSKNTKDRIVKEIWNGIYSEFVSDMMDKCDKETGKRVLALDYDEKSKEGNSHE